MVCPDHARLSDALVAPGCHLTARADNRGMGASPTAGALRLAAMHGALLAGIRGSIAGSEKRGGSLSVVPSRGSLFILGSDRRDTRFPKSLARAYTQTRGARRSDRSTSGIPRCAHHATVILTPSGTGRLGSLSPHLFAPCSHFVIAFIIQINGLQLPRPLLENLTEAPL